VLACAAGVVTMENVAAAPILPERLPGMKVPVVNVVDLMTVRRPQGPSSGMSPTLFTEVVTDTVDVVFAFHGYPGAIHQLVHGSPAADRFRLRGLIEEGTTTTPFDMTLRNRASRYHLVIDAINNARRLPRGPSDLKEWCERELADHASYIIEHLEDMPEVQEWSLGDWAHRG
jgi:xylulose-5-phosphate/fructose-6-phosphate phosphoketolase